MKPPLAAARPELAPPDPAALAAAARGAVQAAAAALASAQARLDALDAALAPPPPEPPPELLTIQEAADRLRVSRNFIAERIHAGQLPSIAVGRNRRIPAAAFDEFVRRRATGADR